MSVVHIESKLSYILHKPPFVSLIYILLFSLSSLIVNVILSLSLSALCIAGGLKKYKSKIISFFFVSESDSGHVIEVIKLLSVILNKHRATGISLKSSIEFRTLLLLELLFLVEVKSTNLFGLQSSPSELMHSLTIEIAAVYIFE